MALAAPSWNRTVRHLRRYRHIMAVLMKYGFDELTDALRRKLAIRVGPRAVPARVRRDESVRSRPVRARLALQELGPTFIKLGQLLSTRPDMLPQEYIVELEKLQDDVPPEAFELIQAEIEKELGAPLADLFASFEHHAIAAGSIAQVYRAVTREGHIVAVKVRRPGIVQALRTECEILLELAGLLKAGLPRDETIDPVRMVREFTTAVEKEVDFTNERRNLERFQRGFADDPTIHVPGTFDAYCTDAVLTMEFIDGVKPSTRQAVASAGYDPTVVADRGAAFVLRQIFDLGFFHADPHPGNFFVLAGSVLAPLDFGQVAHLTAADRQMLADLVLAIVDQDASRLVSTFERSEMLDVGTDLHSLVADMEEMLQQYHGMPLREIPFNKLMMQTFELMRKHRVRPPAQFTLMLKSLMTIESLARALNPDFQIIEHLRPYARRLAWERADPRKFARQARRAMLEGIELAGKLPENLSALMRRLRSGQVQVHIRHEHLETLIFTLHLSANRISFALIIAGLLVGSSILVTQAGSIFGLVRTQTLGLAGYVTAALLGLWLVISILRGRHFEE